MTALFDAGELNKQNAGATSDPSAAKGALEILEMEIYAPLGPGRAV